MKKHKLTSFDNQTGQTTSHQGATMGSIKDSSTFSHNKAVKDASNLTNLIKSHSGGALPGPKLGTSGTQHLLRQSSALHAGWGATPDQLKNATPGTGLAFSQGVVLKKGGGRRRKKTKQSRKTAKRKTKRRTKCKTKRKTKRRTKRKTNKRR